MKDTKKKLNKGQLQAIKHGEGPLLIIAGAGTGKTTVITERIKYLINKGLAKPEEILALTFTEKAATEMETRVDEVMPLSYGDIWIMTFHSFCDQILRENGLHIGLPTNFKLMTTAESVGLFKRNLFEFSLDYFRPLGNPNKFINAILSHFSRLQDELITPSDYLDWITKNKKLKNLKLTEEEKMENVKWLELATVYKEYNDLKLKKAKFDFGDLIIKTVELFIKRPNILLKYQEKFKYILVDEFQDTNFGQNELANLIAKKDRNITVVADDNQSVYAFRGAAISNLLKFKEVYPKATTVTLNENYRSTQLILDESYKLIKNNDPDTLEYRMGISKKLSATKDKQNVNTVFIHAINGDEEAEEVVKEIIKLINGGKSYKDIAILVRANNHADFFVRELERNGIPHQFLGPSRLLEKEEVVDLISYLKSLYNPEDTGNFYRLISSKFLHVEPMVLLRVNVEARRKSLSIFEVIAENNEFEILVNIYKKHSTEINVKTAGEILYEYMKEMKIYEKILKDEDDVASRNISMFFQKIKSFENENPNASFFQVVDYITLLTEVGESPIITNDDWQENNAVNILTVHSSKGLEFPVVFLVNLVNERFPSRNRSEDLPIPNELIKEELPKGDFHLQEERRLFYVGMTRAKERLYLTSAKYYGDGKREKKISQFVLEVLDKPDNYKTVIIKQNNIFDAKKTSKSIFLKKKKKLVINYLSVSQIETFKACPMHYKLKYIYKLGTPPSGPISFGISIHETLREFMETKHDILKIYKANFKNDGYENKKHKEEYFKKGEQYLLGFLKSEHDKKIKTVELEKKFKIKIDKTLTIGGTIDRIDDLGGGRYEVIDYKTGEKIPTQKDVDKNIQLSFYALATSFLFDVKPEEVKLSLYYLDTQEKITTRRTKEDLENLKKEILEIRDEIENSDFKCNNSYFCQQQCEFSMFCKKAQSL